MIKMKVNKNKNSTCSCCKTKWNDTAEMLDVMINQNQIFSLCRKCSDTLFKKILKAQCMYDNRLKSKEDQARSYREKQIEEEISGETYMSINKALKGVKINDRD